MENLNAEQVKKALECCGLDECRDCPCYTEELGCDHNIELIALALINSQEQEKEKLGFLISEIEKEKRELWEERNRIYNDLQDWKAIAEGYQKQFEDCADDRAKLTEKNERLRAEVSVKKKLLDKCVDLEDKVRADTVRKMQERFNEEVAKLLISPSIQYQASAFIDRIAKEMLEGKNDNT